MSAEYTLHYFDVRGKGELIRLCFVAAGQPYVDKRYSFADWPRIKPEMPLKQMPVLEMPDGQMRCQSLSIARYVAKKFDLMGETLEEELFVDMIVETLWGELGTRIGEVFLNSADHKQSDVALFTGNTCKLN